MLRTFKNDAQGQTQTQKTTNVPVLLVEGKSDIVPRKRYEDITIRVENVVLMVPNCTLHQHRFNRCHGASRQP